MFRFAQTHPKSTAFVGFVLPGTLATVVEYALTGGTTGVIPIVAALLAGVPTLAVLYFLGAFSDQPSKDFEQAVYVVPSSNAVVASDTGSETLSVDPRSEVVGDRFFTPRTPKELVEEQQGNTSLAADEVSKRHQGHWMEVTGSVKDVENTYRAIEIFIETNDPKIYVHLDFDKDEWKNKLRSLRKGDVVTAIGEITRTTDLGISLENCELKRARSKASTDDELSRA